MKFALTLTGFPGHRRFALGSGLVVAALFAIPVRGASDLDKEMAELARQVEGVVKDRGNVIQVGDFVAKGNAARQGATGGTAIAKALVDQLTKRGVNVSRTADLLVSGEYRDVTDKDSKTTALQIKAKIEDRHGETVVELDSRGLFSLTTIASLVGITTVTQPFYLGTHEVTRGQFRRFVDDAGYQTEAEKDGKGGHGWNEETKKFEQNTRYNWQNAGFDQTDHHPVVNVSWNDARAFVAWLSKKEGKTYRLPTEAEWEYACRAGSKTRYSFGDDPEGLAAVGNVADGTAKEKYPAWTWAIAARDGYIYTAPVGRFSPNAWGLYDMHGNVSEWCSDGYAADYYKRSPVDDPPGVLGASYRVYRGGGWINIPRRARSARRSRFVPGSRSDPLGFRLALVQSSR